MPTLISTNAAHHFAFLHDHTFRHRAERQRSKAQGTWPCYVPQVRMDSASLCRSSTRRWKVEQDRKNISIQKYEKTSKKSRGTNDDSLYIVWRNEGWKLFVKWQLRKRKSHGVPLERISRASDVPPIVKPDQRFGIIVQSLLRTIFHLLQHSAQLFHGSSRGKFWNKNMSSKELFLNFLHCPCLCLPCLLSARQGCGDVTAPQAVVKLRPQGPIVN